MTPDERVRARVRRAVVDDAGQLLTLQYAAWVIEAIANGTLAIPALHETLDDVRAQIGDETCPVWVLAERGRLLATVRSRQLPEGGGYLGRLAVAPDLRGQGLGAAMLRWGEAQLPTDVHSIELVTGIRSLANHEFYRRHGYEPAGDDEAVGIRMFRKSRALASTD